MVRKLPRLYSGVPAILRNCRSVLIIFLQPQLLCFFSTPPPPPSPDVLLRPSCPRAALNCATCPPELLSPLPRPRAGFPWPLHVALPPPEPPRVPPASPAPVRPCSTPLSFKTCTEASSRPRLPTRTLYFAGHPFPVAQLLAGAPLQPVLIVVSRLHHLPPAIQCSRSTIATHCSSPPHPISVSYTRAASSIAPASSKLHRRSASPSTHRYRASSPQPRAPAAPHQHIEAS
jgi:hypothetical protein